jgi:hypothetical protein
MFGHGKLHINVQELNYSFSWIVLELGGQTLLVDFYATCYGLKTCVWRFAHSSNAIHQIDIK